MSGKHNHLRRWKWITVLNEDGTHKITHQLNHHGELLHKLPRQPRRVFKHRFEDTDVDNRRNNMRVARLNIPDGVQLVPAAVPVIPISNGGLDTHASEPINGYVLWNSYTGEDENEFQDVVPNHEVRPTQTRTSLPPKLRWKKEHPLPSKTRGIQK